MAAAVPHRLDVRGVLFADTRSRWRKWRRWSGRAGPSRGSRSALTAPASSWSGGVLGSQTFGWAGRASWATVSSLRPPGPPAGLAYPQGMLMSAYSICPHCSRRVVAANQPDDPTGRPGRLPARGRDQQCRHELTRRRCAAAAAAAAAAGSWHAAGVVHRPPAPRTRSSSPAGLDPGSGASAPCRRPAVGSTP